MKPGRPDIQRPKQTVAQDLRDSLLNLVRSKFYAESGDDAKCFAQDRTRLLKWVILWPAGWLNEKGVTLPADRYKQIFSNVILEAVRHGNTSRIKYRPAWLRMVLQSHFRIHGEDYYMEAKSARSLAEHALLMVGKLQVRPEADPVRQLAEAASLLARSNRPKQPSFKPAQKDQLNLL